MTAFIKFVNAVNRSMLWFLGSVLMIMALSLFYSVIMRYFLDKPVTWSFDLAGWFSGIAAFLGGGYALLRKEHVRVDLVYVKFPDRMKSLVDILTSVFFFIVVIVLVWKGGEQVINNYQKGVIANTGLNVYVWIKWLMVPIGGILIGLQGIVNLINDFYMLIKGKKLYEEGM